MEPYIAGFFDGEGYVGLAPGYPCIIITQKDKKPLEVMYNYTELGKVYDRGKNQRNVWQWKIHTFDEVEKFINLVIPYIIVKKDQCIWLSENLKYWNYRQGNKVSNEVKVKRMQLREEEKKMFR
jgi:hypothetical protein